LTRRRSRSKLLGKMANCEAFKEYDCKVLEKIGAKDISCIATPGYDDSFCIINRVAKRTLSKNELLKKFAELARMVTQKRR